MSRLENFILDCGENDSYPEGRTELHDGITFEMAAAVAKLLPDKGKILDIGCGQGPALQWFSENGFDATGITTNVQDLLACENRGYHVLATDQNCMPPMWTEHFDCVWARHVLEHSIAPFWTLHEFRRVLKPQGILYIETPAPDTECDHASNPNHYSVLGWKAWASLITRTQFEILEARQRQIQTLAGADLYFSFIAKKI